MGVTRMDVRTQARRTVMILLIVVGATAMGISTQLDRIWWILVFFLIGMTCLSLLLLQISDALSRHLTTGTFPWWPWAFGGMGLFGLAVVAGSITKQWTPFLAIAGMVLLTLGIIGMFLWLGRAATGFDQDDEPGTGGGAEAAPAPSIGVGTPAW